MLPLIRTVGHLLGLEETGEDLVFSFLPRLLAGEGARLDG